VVIDAVADHTGRAFRIDHQRVVEGLRELFAAAIGFLAR
jgi:hypothetical protein